MYIPNDDTQNYPFCRLQSMVKSLDTQTNKPTNQVPKDFKPTNKKSLKKNSLPVKLVGDQH